jgi:ribosome-binding factor A
MRTTHSRPDRIGQSIQRELARLLAEGLKDPRIGFVTVTGVEVSPDLREANVFYSCYGTEAEQKATRQGLQSARTFLQHATAQALQLRNTPHLHFRFDGSVAEGDKIERLIKSVHEHDRENE